MKSYFKKRTAKTVDQVRAWIENTPHHIAEAEFPKNSTGGIPDIWGMVLKSYHEQLRIPKDIWVQCHIKPSTRFDTRMYRWDFEKELKILFGEIVDAGEPVA